MSLVIKESIRILSSFILSNTKLSNTIESNFVLSTLVVTLLNPTVLKLHEKNNVIKDKNFFFDFLIKFNGLSFYYCFVKASFYFFKCFFFVKFSASIN